MLLISLFRSPDLTRRFTGRNVLYMMVICHMYKFKHTCISIKKIDLALH